MSDQNQIKMVSVKDKDFWIEFMAMYRNYPCLWDVKNDNYTSKISRDKAIQNLLQKAKEMFPNANKEFVKKKIINLRSCFSREYKKIKKSKMISSNSSKKIYQTNLWYYNELLFLKENKMSTEGQKSSLAESIEVKEKELFKEEYQLSLPKQIQSVIPEVKKTKKCNSQQQQQQQQQKFFDQIACDYTIEKNTIESEYDIIGKRLSFQLKKMEERQRLIAEKLIGEIMFYGQTKQLKDNTKIILEPDISQAITSQTLSYIPHQHIQNLTGHFEQHSSSSSVSNKDEPSEFI